MRIRLFQFVLFLPFVLVPTAFAGAPPTDDELRLDRYTLQKKSARPEQIDLLSVLVETEFPSPVDSVGSAIDYLLDRSGYRRIAIEESAASMALPLPEVHRKIGPLSLRDAMTTLAGPALELRENAEERVVWFEKRQVASSSSDPVPPDQGQQAGSGTPSQANSSMAGHQVWTLAGGATLRENLADWASDAGWQLEWAFERDYHIKHAAEFTGTFSQAVTAALEYYRSAPVALSATFFHGNSVLLIEPALTRER